MANRQDYMDVSCSDPNGNVPEAFKDKSTTFDFKTDDGSSIDTTTGSKPQGGGDSNKMNTSDPENKTSIEHGEDNDFLSHRSNIEETDIKEEKNKAFDGASPTDNSSTGLQEKNLRPQRHGSNNRSIEIFESEQNGDGGCRPDDDVLTHEQVNNSVSGSRQAGRDASNFTTGDSVNIGRRKRKKPKRSGNNISKDRNTEDKISSGHGEDENGLSCRRPESEDHTLTTEKNPNPLSTTSATCQQDGNASAISAPRVSSPCGSKFCTILGFIILKASICIFQIFVLSSLTSVQALPVEPQWQQFWFNKTDGSLINQTLTIKNMDLRNSEGCSFNFTTVPFFHNCSSASLVFVENEARVEMLTKDLSTEEWSLQYGRNRNGDDLSAARGGTLNESSVMAKISEYTKPATSSPPPTLHEDNGRIWEIVVAVIAGLILGAIFLALVFLLLYKFHPEFQSWVNNDVWRGGGRNTPENDTTAPENVTNASENDTRAPENVTNASENDTRATENVTNASENDTRATENVTNASENDTRAPENVTNASKNDTRAPENVTNPSKNDTRATENVTNASENDNIATENVINVSEDDNIATENVINVSEDDTRATENDPNASEYYTRATENVTSATEDDTNLDPDESSVSLTNGQKVSSTKRDRKEDIL